MLQSVGECANARNGRVSSTFCCQSLQTSQKALLYDLEYPAITQQHGTDKKPEGSVDNREEHPDEIDLQHNGDQTDQPRDPDKDDDLGREFKVDLSSYGGTDFEGFPLFPDAEKSEIGKHAVDDGDDVGWDDEEDDQAVGSGDPANAIAVVGAVFAVGKKFVEQ